MKYLFSLLAILLIVSTGLSQTSSPVLGQTTLIYRDTFRKGIDVADTINYMRIDGASDFRLLWTSEDSTDVVIKYSLRNSTTGQTTALATIDSMVTVKTDGSKGIGTVVALTTLVGYDQVMFQLTQSGDNYNGATAGKYIKIYIYPVAVSGGFSGDVQGRKPTYNKAIKLYEKLNYDDADATDTTAFISLNGIANIRMFVTSNDSLVEVLGYILNNSIIDSTTAVTNLTTVTFDAHTTTVADSALSAGNILVATLAGWNRIKFVSNPTASGTRDLSAETGKRYRVYGYFQRRVPQ
jgi:hypothetical protein